jgi:hypothetical protein
MDPPSVESVGDSRRWVRRRTNVVEAFQLYGRPPGKELFSFEIASLDSDPSRIRGKQAGQAPINKEDLAESAGPKGHTVFKAYATTSFKALAAINEVKSTVKEASAR